LAITEHCNRTMPDVDFACGYTIEVVGSHVVDFAARVSATRSLWGAALRRTMFDTTTAPASASSAKLFRSSTTGSSCTTPSAVAHVLFGHHDNDQRLIDHSTGKVREIVRAADGEDGWDVNRTAHLMGTCRMGRDPRASTETADRMTCPISSFCDGSVFPTLEAVNPSLILAAGPSVVQVKVRE
jgi:choline dehydrogenase-like flavoprotein